MVHEQDESMPEIQVCSPARKYFLLHSKDMIQNNAGAEFVSAQDNELRKIILKRNYIVIPAEISL
jgi:hypothetical protein